MAFSPNDRVRLVDDSERFPCLGTVLRVSRAGYLVVKWDDESIGHAAHFSPGGAETSLMVVTGDDARPRHDWDCAKDLTDPPCLRCGAIQTDANELGPCEVMP